MNNKKVKVEIHVADLIKPKKKYLYPCYCINCKGVKVDSRTQKKHTKEESRWKSENIRKHQENAITSRKPKKPLNIITKKQKRINHHATSLNTNSSQPNNEDFF